MNVPSLPKMPLKLHTGSDSDDIPLPKMFTRRLDIIIPAHSAQEARLGAQVARYAITSGVRLVDVLSSYTAEEARIYADMTMSAQDEEEAWCIDGQLGMFTLKVPKEVYQSLGITGKDVSGAYIIQVDLKDKTTKLYSHAKDAIEKWDKKWDVWTVEGMNVADRPTTTLEHRVKNTEPEIMTLKDVLVPTGLPSEGDEDEVWAEMFEWIGMCTIGASGSPRISSTNQVNPYISSYSAPEGSKTGSLTRFRWEGPLSHKFVQDTLQVARAWAISDRSRVVEVMGTSELRDVHCTEQKALIKRPGARKCVAARVDMPLREREDKLGERRLLVIMNSDRKSRVLEVIAKKVAAGAAYWSLSWERLRAFQLLVGDRNRTARRAYAVQMMRMELAFTRTGVQDVIGPAGRILGGARVRKCNERHVAIWQCLGSEQSALVVCSNKSQPSHRRSTLYPTTRCWLYTGVVCALSRLNSFLPLAWIDSDILGRRAYSQTPQTLADAPKPIGIPDLHVAWSPPLPSFLSPMAQYIPGSSVTISASLSALAHQPVVDDAHEEDVWKSWRSMTRHKHEIANGVRLENASWRTWWKQRNKLRTVSPETLNCLRPPPPLHNLISLPFSGLHILSLPPIRPAAHKEPTLSDKLDLMKSAGKKPILKHRTLTELLSLPRPASPILESSDLTDEESIDYSTEAGVRPPLAHTKSDTNIIRRPSNRRISPPRVAQSMSDKSAHQENPVPTLQVNGLEKTRSRGSESSNSPRGGSSDIESNSGKERRHIHFNTFVEQCISIDKPRSPSGDDDSEDEEADDDILEMRSISGSSTTSVVSNIRPSFTRRDSSDKDLVSIAPIAPTVLKSSDPHPAPSPAVVFVPPNGSFYEGEHQMLQYHAQQQNNENYTPPPANVINYAPPSSTSSSTSSRSNWEDEDEDYGVGFDYFGGPDLGIGQEYANQGNPRGNSYVARSAQRDQPSSVSSDVSTTPTQRDAQLAHSVAEALAGRKDREDEHATSSNSSHQSDSTVQAPAQRSPVVANGRHRSSLSSQSPPTRSPPRPGRSILKNADSGSSVPAAYRGSYESPPDSAYLSPTDLRGRSLSPGERNVAVRTYELPLPSKNGNGAQVAGPAVPSARGSATTGEDASRTVPIGVVANAIVSSSGGSSNNRKPKFAQGTARPSLVINHSPVSKEDATSGSLEEGVSGAELERRRDDFWADSTDYAPPPVIHQATKSVQQEKPRKAADDQAHAQDEVDDGGSQYSYVKGGNAPANKTPANSPVMHRSRPLPSEVDMAKHLPHVSTPLPPTPPHTAASTSLAQNKPGEHVDDPTIVGRAVDIVHSAKGYFGAIWNGRGPVPVEEKVTP
ncbi:carbohydrate metabolism-related protein [Rhizoctonia solani]|uniref:Carbohydrate metabolism-related protein n=1 Tax=Rhizoctonia solani TaxID=456999 RepID=A0A8H7IKP7_9AGAM|nr:carbohydrate metabolism-related protein [Rhizoctonia solani]